MKFHVGPFVYQLLVQHAPILNDHGESCLGLARYLERQILIAAKAPAERRIEILAHELRHAWGFHVPPPANEEQESQLLAMISHAMAVDLQAQGGLDALLAHPAVDLPPAQPEVQTPSPARPAPPERAYEDLEAPLPDDFGYQSPRRDRSGRRLAPAPRESWETQARPSGGRVSCKCCGLVVADGSVRTSKAFVPLGVKGRVVHREFYCDFCGILWSWREGLSPAGEPNGAVQSGPHETRDRNTIDKFLRDFPPAAGLVAG